VETPSGLLPKSAGYLDPGLGWEEDNPENIFDPIDYPVNGAWVSQPGPLRGKEIGYSYPPL
jgi:hypothetical protein